VIFNRQKVTGWIMVIAAGAYLAYFLRVRVLTPGPLLTGQDWFNLITAIVVLMIGTANLRLAAMREQGRRPPSSQ
jgi:hypothetical protein